MSEDTYVYVVTHGPFGSEQGEFFREEAFFSFEDARREAFICMKEKGGQFEQGDSGPHEHVVERWDNHLTLPPAGCTVWLERLVLSEMEPPTEAEDEERERQGELMGRLDPDGIARISKRAHDELMIALECAEPQIIPDDNDVATLGPYRVGPATDLKGCPVCNELVQQPPEEAETLRAVLSHPPAAGLIKIIGKAMMIEDGPGRDAVEMFLNTEIPEFMDRFGALLVKIRYKPLGDAILDPTPESDDNSLKAKQVIAVPNPSRSNWSPSGKKTCWSRCF